MDRLAKPVTGPDLLSPFRGDVQEAQGPPLHRRFEPRNLEFADGFNWWRIVGTFLRQGGGFDYSCTTAGGRATLAAAVPEPAGFVFLNQEIFADDYRGGAITFRGELRTTDVASSAGLVLRVTSQGTNTADPDRAIVARPIVRNRRRPCPRCRRALTA